MDFSPTSHIDPHIEEVQLIIDRSDVIVRRFIAGKWSGPSDLHGMTYIFPLKVDAVSGYDRNKNPLSTTILPDKQSIQLTFATPIHPGEKYVYEYKMLLNHSVIQHFGPLNIIEWPKEALTEILFLRDAGSIFFCSALGKMELNPKTGIRRIIPGNFSKALTSHARSASGIRIEWGGIPRIQLVFEYRATNTGTTDASQVEITSFLPPTTKFQQVSVISPCYEDVRKDKDENVQILIPIGSLPGMESFTCQCTLNLTPIGNTTVVLPNFGSWEEYKQVTTLGSVGEAMIQASKYWPIDDPSMDVVVNTLKKNSKNASQYIQLAFEFVNQKISYQRNSVRDTAVTVLKTRSGDCSEYSDLLVCLLRAAKIPAKIVHGWILELEKRALEPHAWCEFFSPRAGGWRQCDPTWGFLTGVSAQHLSRQREGIISDQHNFAWRYVGDATIEVEETVRFNIESPLKHDQF